MITFIWQLVLLKVIYISESPGAIGGYWSKNEVTLPAKGFEPVTFCPWA